MWGPVVRTHIVGDPGIGAVTYEGRLRMISSGFDTDPEFLDAVASMLTGMSA
ncbi:hypothetical protein [Mycolicibacterium baixiangningiae]|uniref:hypothetical protein n=1 Tax=Mycolicibacterium baixiangningiae TaxID=2761578 RepID=UPI0018687CB0|nr:hypothetical protein [Mycolicibacterium baixiangningiae]